MFKPQAFASGFASILLASALMTHAQPVKYSPAAPAPGNTYVTLDAPAACKNAAIVTDPALLETAAESSILEALEGRKATPGCPCSVPDGALQVEGMCKAQVHRLKADATVYQGAEGNAKYWAPDDKFWVPFNPRLIASAVTKVHRCIVPKGTVVVIGMRRNPHKTAEEYVTQWYIGDTGGTGTLRKKLPSRWRCDLS